MIAKTVYFDLDGTLIDVYDRYLSVLNDYLKLSDSIPINKDEYICGKRKGLKEHEIVNSATGFLINISEYMSYKRKELEKWERLCLDTLLCQPKDIRRMKTEMKYQICLLTFRRNAELCRKQLDLLGIEDVFDEIFIVREHSSMNPKAAMIKNKINSEDAIIGDSYMDMECAKILGVKGYFVRTGLGVDSGENAFDNVLDVINFLIEN